MNNENCERDNLTPPALRKLRAYAFDPSLSLKLDTTVLNNIIYKVPWEKLKPGPVGEYIEVVDYDPSSKRLYKPVDLENTYILGQDGLDPSEGNPQFHQQMVYAVAMTTIINFERALGRKIIWSPYQDEKGKPKEFVQRLRIYPHALREANAYYSPQKKALLFGYFNAIPDIPSLHMPGCTVYTCLSHDIIAHEITHALLDGMHRRYIEATHIDSLAFHEAFADIVALFQHFTFPDVLKDQIAKTAGDLGSHNLLGELAQEFGKAIGHYGSLRDAIGQINKETGKWEPHTPSPEDYEKVKEPHGRGAILVATIFDAFINLYKRRSEDLIRIATGGTGVLAKGSIHPDLVNRLAHEASKTAGHILKMCIRALDYCPPMDINFGDYLRALITSDYDLVDEDDMQYRVAIIEAFQRRGIFPDNVKGMSIESLLCRVEEQRGEFEDRFISLINFFRFFKEKISYVTNREKIYELTKVFITGGIIEKTTKPGTNLTEIEKVEKGLHEILSKKFMGEEDTRELAKLTGLILDDYMLEQQGVGTSETGKTLGFPLMEVHNLKLATRVGPNGKILNQILVTLTQKRGVVAEYDEWGNVNIKGFFVPNKPANGWYERVPVDGNPKELTYEKRDYPGHIKGLDGPGSENVLPEGWLIFRGGSTLIFDLDYSFSKDEVKLKYIIKKDITDEKRMKRQFKTLYHKNDYSLNATYFGNPIGNLEAEPFAMIHKVL